MEQNNLGYKFNAIIGFDKIPYKAQKPNPYGSLKCLKLLIKQPINKTILNIGDHEGDVEFARNIGNGLSGKAKVLSIAVKYSGANPKYWQHRLDFEIEKPSD